MAESYKLSLCMLNGNWIIIGKYRTLPEIVEKIETYKEHLLNFEVIKVTEEDVTAKVKELI